RGIRDGCGGRGCGRLDVVGRCCGGSRLPRCRQQDGRRRGGGLGGGSRRRRRGRGGLLGDRGGGVQFGGERVSRRGVVGGRGAQQGVGGGGGRGDAHHESPFWSSAQRCRSSDARSGATGVGVPPRSDDVARNGDIPSPEPPN